MPGGASDEQDQRQGLGQASTSLFEASPEFDAVRVAEQIATLSFIKCLYGQPCPVPVTVRLDEARVRELRWSAYCGLYFSQDRLERMFFRELRFVALYSHVILRSSWLNGGVPLPCSLKRLAHDSGLSIPTLVSVIADAEAMGDISKQRLHRDRRLLVLEPSETLINLACDVARAFSRAISAFTGRADRFETLKDSDRLAFIRLQSLMASSLYHDLHNDEGGFDRKSFLFGLVDIAIDGPLPVADYLEREAVRLRVTPQTVRHIIQRAREAGWLQPVPELAMSSWGTERLCAALSVLEARWNLLVSALERSGAIGQLNAVLTARLQPPQAADSEPRRRP